MKISIVILSFLLTAGCDRTQPPAQSTISPGIPGSTSSSSGATSPTTSQASTSPGVSPPAGTPADTNTPDACDSGPCEETAFMLVRPSVSIPQPTPIKLSGPERDALTSALNSSKANDSGAHIHADVVDRRLVFTADKPSDPATGAHVSGNEPEISLANGGPAKKVVATGPALRLLQKRAAR